MLMKRTVIYEIPLQMQDNGFQVQHICAESVGSASMIYMIGANTWRLMPAAYIKPLNRMKWIIIKVDVLYLRRVK